MIKLSINSSYWVEYPSNTNTIFVIKPGACTKYNELAYKTLESKYNVVYFAESRGEYDHYPDNWQINKNVDTHGKHLGGIVQLMKKYIIEQQNYPYLIIVGSRGGQVTLGKIWETLWKGPSIIINAGCLTTYTQIPKEVIPIFITMGNDYFTTVNSIEKVETLFNSLIQTPNQKGMCIHLPKESHMPRLKNELQHLLLYSSQYSQNIINTIPINSIRIKIFN
jgi:hypothetical protein